MKVPNDCTYPECNNCPYDDCVVEYGDDEKYAEEHADEIEKIVAEIEAIKRNAERDGVTIKGSKYDKTYQMLRSRLNYRKNHDTRVTNELLKRRGRKNTMYKRRQESLQRTLSFIKRKKVCSRAQIAREMGVSSMSVGRDLKILKETYGDLIIVEWGKVRWNNESIKF